MKRSIEFLYDHYSPRHADKLIRLLLAAGHAIGKTGEDISAIETRVTHSPDACFPSWKVIIETTPAKIDSVQVLQNAQAASSASTKSPIQISLVRS